MKNFAKSKGKRITAALLCAVMCIMSLPLSAFAFTAEEGKTVDAYYGDRYFGSDGDYYYSPESYQYIAYDENGNTSLHYAGGDHRRTKLMIKDNSGSRQIMCIEFGIDYNAGGTYSSVNGKNSSYFQNLPTTAQYGIMLTSVYGWRPGKTAPISGTNEDDFLYATQTILWEYQQQLRTSPTTLKANSYGIPADTYYQCLKGRPAEKCYNWLLTQMQSHATIPSFASNKSSSATTYTLKYNQAADNYSLTLTDTNNTLSDIKFSASGITVSRSGNRYTFTSNKMIETAVSVTAQKNVPGIDGNFLVWGYPGKQTMMSGVEDPVVFYLKIKTETTGVGHIVKHSEDGKVANIKFNIAGNGVNQTVTTKTDGTVDIELMPGVYTVHQTSSWEGRELMKDFDVFIAQNGQTYRCLINNANFESYIKVVKKDAETGKTIPYAGAGFQIYDSAGNKVSMTFTYPTPTTIDTFYTDADGQLVTPEKLEYGKGYSLVEVQALYGYVLDSTPVSFDVTEENSTQEGGITLIKVDKPNMAQKCTISIEKTGEVFFGVNVSGEEDKDVIYQPVYTVKGLAGAVYEITADEDIITPDGTLRYHKGDVVDTVTTDDEGFAKSKELYLGKYTVVETKAPTGMVINNEKHSVELTYAGQDVAVTETATSFYNERQKVKIYLEKVLEQNEAFGVGKNDEIKNIGFGLYAKEDIVSSSGTAIPADGLIEIITLDENRKATVNTDLPFGSYYIKEISTDEHYILSDTQYPFTFEYAGQDTETVEIKVNDGKPIENKLIYGSVSGKKIDENGEALSGALIGIFKADETVFTREHALMTAVSQKDGSFSFAKVPYGNWIVREIEAPTGFVLDDTSYEVNISENEQVVEVKITNEYIHGNIQLTKVDADFPANKLTGATFEVYKDVNGDGKLDDGDELIGNLEETATGIYEMKELLYGKYLVKETKAPEGFVLDKGVYSVFIEKDETTYKIENKAGVGFINEAMKGNLKIKKTSSDGKVEGFTFRVTGVNGYDSTFTTDKNGEIFIEGLRIGEYTVSEVSDNVSAGYVLPADKKASVKTDSTAIAEMHNVVIDTPKTGDNSKLGLWLALLGVSAAGIGVTVYAGVRKKKKEDAE